MEVQKFSFMVCKKRCCKLLTWMLESSYILLMKKDTAIALLSMGKKGTKYYPLWENHQSSFWFLNLEKDFQFVPSVMQIKFLDGCLGEVNTELWVKVKEKNGSRPS